MHTFFLYQTLNLIKNELKVFILLGSKDNEGCIEEWVEVLDN